MENLCGIHNQLGQPPTFWTNLNLYAPMKHARLQFWLKLGFPFLGGRYLVHEGLAFLSYKRKCLAMIINRTLSIVEVICA